MDDNTLEYVSAFMAIAAFAGGTFVLYKFCAAALFSMITVKKWKAAEGIVTEYAVKPTDDNESWYKAIKYTYVIKGVTFTGTCLSRNIYMAFQSASHTDEYYADYRIGQKITVKYNPDNPEDAVIEHAFDGMNIIWLLFGSGLLYYAYYNFPWLLLSTYL